MKISNAASSSSTWNDFPFFGNKVFEKQLRIANVLSELNTCCNLFPKMLCVPATLAHFKLGCLSNPKVIDLCVKEMVNLQFLFQTSEEYC